MGARMRKRTGRLLGAAVALVLCAACIADQPRREVGSGAIRSSSAPASGSTHAMNDEGARSPAPVGDVRLTLERLLGHHAVLMIRLMRGPIDNEPTFVAAARQALDRNTAELVLALGQAYGTTAGSEFRHMWLQHIAALQQYCQAVASRDAEGRRQALITLQAYSARYGDLIARVTHGRLTSAAVANGVAQHVRHMVRATDAYGEGNYQRAFEMERMAYAAMFVTGRQLAVAAPSDAPGELPVAFNSPSETLRSALGRLLGEHAELAFDATRAIVAGRPGAGAAAQALNANTSDLLQAMNGAVGYQAASSFGRVWAAHINALVAFAVAVADSDDDAQSRARARLDKFPARLSSLLVPLSHGRVRAAAIVAALREHDQQLLQQLTAYAARDYATAHALAYAGYDHMFMIAGTLADVLAGRSAAAAPLGGAATGGGGMSHR
jgi:hypothetical protein